MGVSKPSAAANAATVKLQHTCNCAVHLPHRALDQGRINVDLAARLLPAVLAQAVNPQTLQQWALKQPTHVGYAFPGLSKVEARLVRGNDE